MAVQVSKSGGIYIEISGDYTKLQSDLKQVDALAKAAGKDISDALSGALKPNEAARNATNLSKYLATAQRAAQATKADLSGMDAEFRKMGQAIGVAEKNLDGYVKMQRQMFQTQAQKAYLDNLKGVQRLTGLTDDEMNKLAKSMGGVGNEFSKASEGIKIFGVSLDEALAVSAAAFVGKKVLNFGVESFDLAARYQTLGVVVRQVGQISGQTAVQVDANVSALRRMGIAGIEARKTLTQLTQAQVDIATAPGLARVAQDAAVIGGTNSSEAFEKMVHGIQSAQIEVLRTIGINVNFEQSYAKLAASLGKTTSDLTEQEKVQARLNAVMEAGEKISGSYEAAMTTLGKQMSSIPRIQQDLATDLGKLIVDLASATGGVKAYTVVLEGWNANILALRGAMAGLSLDELAQAGRSGGAQGLRDLAEGMETAEEEAARFETQLAAVVGKLSATDTTFFRNQLTELKKQFDTGKLSIDSYRRSINDLMVILRAQISQPAIDAPQADVLGIQGMVQGLREQYGKTDGAKQQRDIKDAKEQLRLLRTLKGEFSKSEYSDMATAFQGQLDKLTKGSRTASLASERTSYQAAEAARTAADSLKNLQLQYSQLTAQLDGNSLGAALAKNQRDYETQLDAIAKKEAEIVKNRSLWAKEGKLTGETIASLDEQQKSLEQEKELLRQIKKTNDELARRADLASTYRANMDYASLTGDLRAYYAEQVKSLELQMQSASEAEKRSLSEQKRIAEARANLDVGGMFETGMNEMAKSAQQGIIDFWEKTLPNSIGSAVNTLGVAFAQVGLGTKSVSESFAEMGKTIQSIFQQILSDFINMSIRMAMFGQSGSGGMLGGLVSGIGGLFTGGGADTSAAGTDLLKSNTVAFASANGNVFSAPALSAYSNSIVSNPTIFPFAKGVGLMGEAGAEAIMPLRRGSGGRLGVDASGIGAQQQAPQFNVIVNTPAGVGVAAQEQKQNGQGGFDMTILLEMVDKAMASGISSGRSKTAHAMSMRGI